MNTVKTVLTTMMATIALSSCGMSGKVSVDCAGKACRLRARTDEGRDTRHLGKPEGTTADAHQHQQHKSTRFRRNMRIDHIALFCKDLEKMRQFFLDHFEGVSNGVYHNPRTGLRTYILIFPEVTEQREPSSSLEWPSRDGTRQGHGGARLELMQRPDTIDIDPSKPNIGFIHVLFAEMRKIGIKYENNLS